MTQEEWQKLSPAEKKMELYHRQKKLLQEFRERNAISEEQFQNSLRDMTDKMGIEHAEKNR